MNYHEITERVNHLANTWEHFKSVNDQRLKEIEKKGSSDPLNDQQLARMHQALDHHENRLSQLETLATRPKFAGNEIYEGKSEDTAHQTALRDYLRRGVEVGLTSLEKKALASSNDEDGGYLLTRAMQHYISDQIAWVSPMRQLASVETISTDSLELIDEEGAAQAGWTNETAPVAETSTPKLRKNTISVHELYAQPKATQKLIDDSAINIEDWLQQKISETFAAMEHATFIHGDGLSKPRGILSYIPGNGYGKVEELEASMQGTLTADDLITLQFALREDYASRATFLMHRATVQAVRMLKDPTSHHYLWNPSLATGSPATILGLPVMQTADMPSLHMGGPVIALGDFKTAYQIVDRHGIRVLRDPFTEKPFVKFYATKRVGGGIKKFDALKLLKVTK